MPDQLDSSLASLKGSIDGLEESIGKLVDRGNEFRSAIEDAIAQLDDADVIDDVAKLQSLCRSVMSDLEYALK